MAEVVIRPVAIGELDVLVDLCREHVEYDRGLGEPIAGLPGDLPDRLRAKLFGEPPDLWCFVAEVDGLLAGYASYLRQSSTWRCESYALLDCLFVREGYRSHQLGRRLFVAGVAWARETGAPTLQWQSPADNAAAHRFYDRTGGESVRKLRYALPL
jgi:GNAT superfamily N-acetyltransferase